MPLFLFGSMSSDTSRELHGDDGRIFERGSIWDHFRLTGLATESDLHCVATFWHLPTYRHSCLAWRQDGYRKEQKVIVPGLLTWREALELSRVAFPDVIPSPIIFRIANEDEALIYDD